MGFLDKAKEAANKAKEAAAPAFEKAKEVANDKIEAVKEAKNEKQAILDDPNIQKFVISLKSLTMDQRRSQNPKYYQMDKPSGMSRSEAANAGRTSQQAAAISYNSKMDGLEF